MKKTMEYKRMSDNDLWTHCQQGDEWAYGELFERYFPWMLRTAMRSVKDTQEAEEMVMDSFQSLWVKREQIVDYKFVNYLFGCIYNKVVSYFRKEIPRSVALEQAEHYPADYAADSPLLSEEIQAIYHKALEKLSPRRREVLWMRREENLTYAEIAQKMNLPVGVVKNYMTSAMNGLRATMEEY